MEITSCNDAIIHENNLRNELVQDLQNSMRSSLEKSQEDKNNNLHESYNNALVDGAYNEYSLFHGPREFGIHEKVADLEDTPKSSNYYEYYSEKSYDIDSNTFVCPKENKRDQCDGASSDVSVHSEALREQFQLRVRKYNEENMELQENLSHLDELNNALQIEYNKQKRKLDQCNKLLTQLKNENDEQKDLLKDALAMKRSFASACHKSERERACLEQKLEEAESKIQRLEPMIKKYKKAVDEKFQLREELNRVLKFVEEIQKESEALRAVNIALQTENHEIEETYNNIVIELRNQIKQLRAKNSELLLSSDILMVNSLDNLEKVPTSRDESCYFKYQESLDYDPSQYSLYDELVSSGLATEGGWIDPSNCEQSNIVGMTSTPLAKAAFHHSSMQVKLDSPLVPDVSNIDNKGHLPEQHNFTKGLDATYSLPPQLTKEEEAIQNVVKYCPAIVVIEKSPTEVTKYTIFKDYPAVGVKNAEGVIDLNRQNCDLILKEIEDYLKLAKGSNMPVDNLTKENMDQPVSYTNPDILATSVFLEENKLKPSDNESLCKKLHNFHLIQKMEGIAPAHPRRKLSVFHRSFDVSALESQREEVNNFEVKRSMSTPPEAEKHKETPSIASNNKATDAINHSLEQDEGLNKSGDKSTLLQGLSANITSSDEEGSFSFHENSIFSSHDSSEEQSYNFRMEDCRKVAENPTNTLQYSDVIKSVDVSNEPLQNTKQQSVMNNSSTLNNNESDAKDYVQKLSSNSDKLVNSHNTSAKNDNVHLNERRQRDYPYSDLDFSLLANTDNVICDKKEKQLVSATATVASDEITQQDKEIIKLPLNDLTTINDVSKTHVAPHENLCLSKAEDSKSPLYRGDRRSRSPLNSEQPRKLLVVSPSLYRMDSSESECESDDERLLDLNDIQHYSFKSKTADNDIKVNDNQIEDVNKDNSGGASSIDCRKINQQIPALVPQYSSHLPPCLEKPATLKSNQLDNVNNITGTQQPIIKSTLKIKRCSSDSIICDQVARRKLQISDNLNTKTISVNKEEDRIVAFPSLTDARLRESGIANLPDSVSEYSTNLSESDLERKYTALSTSLSTDRITLARRSMLSIRQRAQSEQNLSVEMHRMRHNIQELAPLCTDRESIERVERVKLQLEMIVQCAHRVSCTAETLGAVHQERRVSRAMLLADKYLQLLRSRCDKLSGEISETKRILMENNIVIEENPGELGDDLPRVRYRSGMITNNRTMDYPRQRNSVSGKVSLRRPSLSSETLKLESDKLDRTGSLSREQFIETESQQNSHEENNNISRNQKTNNLSIATCKIIGSSCTCSSECRTSLKSQHNSSDTKTVEDIYVEPRISITSYDSRRVYIPWRFVFFGIIFFFLGFYVNTAISEVGSCPSQKWWSIEDIIGRFLHTENNGLRPI
ncbi:repetitive organellar protein-like isoform X2 [Prorops nasuta]|uniref:repetitive organellar protein-like isoform X2 n=1 Tax=Prorops nasuta TaxID=863751 RepID=UPI0034CFC9D5